MKANIVIPAAIIVIVLLIAGLFMIGKGQKNPAPANQPVQNQPKETKDSNQAKSMDITAEGCKFDDKDICKYIETSYSGNIYDQGFTVKTKITDKSGKKMESVITYSNKKSQIINYENGKENFNIIVIDNATYTKDYSDKSWMKYEKPQTGQQTNNVYDIEKMKQQLKNTVADINNQLTYQKLGEEACGAFKCFKYEFILSSLPDTKQYIYFDTKNYLLRKIISQAKDGTVTEMEYDYGPVTIKEPSPVKTMDWTKLLQATPAAGGEYDEKALQELQKQLEEQMKNTN